MGFNDSAKDEQKSLKYSKIIKDLENEILQTESLQTSGKYQEFSFRLKVIHEDDKEENLLCFLYISDVLFRRSEIEH